MSDSPIALQPCLLFLLPNEILLRILGAFRTRELLTFTSINTRFHDLVLRILHSRLLAAASLTHHKLILECYHPASKNIEPYLFCDYLGTPGLSNDTPGHGDVYHASGKGDSTDPNHEESELVYHSAQNIGRLGKLAGLYSRFRPIRLEEESRIFVPHPAGDLLAQRMERRILPIAPPLPVSSASSSTAPVAQNADGKEAEQPRLVEHRINLDVDEPFSQLCVVTNLVRLGPRRGVFFNFVAVSDGVVRVKRDWLAARAANTKGGKSESHEERTLWLGNERCIGLKFRVDGRVSTRQNPVLMLRDEDPAATYRLQYEELLVKTTTLLLAVEEALLQDNSTGTGKAMIFGNFVRPS